MSAESGRSFARGKGRSKGKDEGEKQRMLDDENTNEDDIEKTEGDETRAPPKSNRKREKMDRERDRRSAKDSSEQTKSQGGGRRNSNEEDSESHDEPAGAKDEQPADQNQEDNGDVEMAGGKKKDRNWFKGGKSKLFGKGKKRDPSDDEENNDENDVEKGNKDRDDMYLGPLRVLEPLRTDVVQIKEARSKRLERLAALDMPEMHYVGQIVSGRKISSDPTEGVICRWKVGFGKCWEHLGGDIKGQTHVGYCKVREMEEISLNHPIDMHFAEAGVPGWGNPHMAIQCFKLDWNGRKILAGYGFCHFPSSPGFHKIEVPIWRPSGTVEEELHSFFLGRTPSLVSDDPILESAWQNRCRLVTVGAGKINMEIFVTTRNSKPHNFDAVQPKS